MDQSNILKSEKDWNEYTARIKKHYHWVSEDRPYRYPCICVMSQDWDDRYWQYKTCFEFVYADTFGAVEAKTACQAIFNSISNGEDGYWRGGPWADPNTDEGEGGVIEMLRNVVSEQFPI